MNYPKRLVGGLAVVAAAVAIGAAALLSGVGVTEHSDVTYQTDGPDFKDVAEVTKASTAVAHVRVVSAGSSYVIPFDPAVTVVSPPPTDNGPKGKAGQPASSEAPVASPKDGILKTDFTVEVLENVRGAGIKKGDQLTVSQVGGVTADGKTTVNAEHDPLMQVGDEEVLFLNKDPRSGKFFTTGGGIGRFKVQKNGTLLAVDLDSAAGRSLTGRPAASLKQAVLAVR